MIAAIGFALGCSHGPRYRLGGLPFPGPLTLYSGVGDELGSHRYGDQARNGEPREVSRGTIYTCKAGFIDIAHLRETIDWTRYIHEMIEQSLDEGSSSLQFEGLDRAEYELSFDYPPDWAAITAEQRHHAALRLAQRTSLLIMTWHEIVTGAGYKTTGVVSERRSAFTYDDMSAHLIGVEVAAQALRDTQPYDQAVTQALDARVEQLGIVDRRCLKEVTASVKGSWFEGIHALRFQRETGRATGQLMPHVVEEHPCCSDTRPEPLAWPPDDVEGVDLDALVSIEMVPNTRIGLEVAERERLSEDEVYGLLPAPSDSESVLATTESD